MILPELWQRKMVYKDIKLWPRKISKFTGFAFTTVTLKDSSVQAVFEFKVMIHLGF